MWNLSCRKIHVENSKRIIKGATDFFHTLNSAVVFARAGDRRKERDKK